MTSTEAKTQWTEQPWILCEHGDYGDYDGNCRVILGEGGDRRIAIVLGPDDDETRATAAVMAAAPELFTELEEAAAGMTAILTEYKGVMRPVWIDSIERDIAKFVALLQRITQSSTVSEQVKV